VYTPWAVVWGALPVTAGLIGWFWPGRRRPRRRSRWRSGHDGANPRRRDRELDVRELPSYRFGPVSLMWWSTMGLVLIEGTVFAIGVMMYFYLRGVAAAGPSMRCRRSCAGARSTPPSCC
jgi:cytochrome c oxidase subunit I+III